MTINDILNETIHFGFHSENSDSDNQEKLRFRQKKGETA